jgi:hypothetical protein
MEVVEKNSDSIRLSDVLLGRHFGLLLLTNFAAVGLGMVDLTVARLTPYTPTINRK